MKNEPAFPCNAQGNESKIYPQEYSGLTKRELFAAMAMQGILARGPIKVDGYSSEGRQTESQFVAMVAVSRADALIAELAKEKPNE